MSPALYVRHFGDTSADSRCSAVALHGFTASGEAFGELAGLLQRSVIAPDLPGHGGSEPVADVSGAVDAIVDLLRSVAAPRLLIGYSMGGRLALHVALDHPSLVDRLVLVSAGSGIDDDGERAARRRADSALADRLETMAIADFLDEWLTNPIVALPRSMSEVQLQADRAIRSVNQPAHLAAALRSMGQGGNPSLFGRLGELAMPTLLVSGAGDAKYTEIMAHMATAIPDATHVVIPDTPHNVVAASPAELATAIQLWESRLAG